MNQSCEPRMSYESTKRLGQWQDECQESLRARVQARFTYVGFDLDVWKAAHAPHGPSSN